MVAILMATTLVVGLTVAATITPSVFASQKRQDISSKNGNTNTLQKCKQAATESGFDNTEEQECQNLICTHPDENATCTQEGAAAAETPVTPPVTLPTTREVCVGAGTGPGFLYNVVLDADLGDISFY
jgi:hypothetical protein